MIDGLLLRQLRRKHGLSQEKLAWKANVGLTTLIRLERQSRPRCRIRTLFLLAAVLEENPDPIALLVRTNKDSPAQPAGRARVAPLA